MSNIPNVAIGPLLVDNISSSDMVTEVCRSIESGRGGWIITANVHYLRTCSTDPSLLSVVSKASFTVADGMPLVWASHIIGQPLKERITGVDLVHSLSERLARLGGTIALVGGVPETARIASQRLAALYPGLQIAVAESPNVSLPVKADELRQLVSWLGEKHIDVVLVGLGVPKQDMVIESLRTTFPATWWIGVGVSFSFLAGKLKRAPSFVQRLGLEWVHRLIQEPERLWRRYIVEDLPFTIQLMARLISRKLLERKT